LKTRNGNYDIYGLDLTTNEEFQITTDPKDQLYPAILWSGWMKEMTPMIS